MMPLLAKILLQILYMHKCISLQIYQEGSIKKDKSKKPHRRLKKMHTSKKLSDAVAGFSDVKRSFLNMIRETKSFRRSAI